MKKILFIISMAIVSIYAKPCMTDIYFGNGVWNPDRDEVIYTQLKGLKTLMLNRASTRLNKDDSGKLFDWKIAYNPSTGTIDDLIETFWQLKESGQISDGYFTFITGTLAGTDPTSDYFTKLQEIISQYNGDVDTMFTIYQNSSFNQRHNVLLAAHSQGNLFGNKIYTLMSDTQKSKFRMVSVATPADHVAGGGPYVTLTNDPVIAPIAGSLSGNVDGFGHTFVAAYLSNTTASERIALYVKSAYDSLSQSSTCGGYDQIFMHMYELNYIKVYGTPSGTYATKLIGTVSLNKYNPPIKVVIPDIPEDRVIYLCSQPSFFYGDLNLFTGSFDDDHLSYKPGTIYNKETLESREGLSYTITSRDGKKCADVSFTGELYDLALSAFD